MSPPSTSVPSNVELPESKWFTYFINVILRGVEGMVLNENARCASFPAPWRLTGRGCILAMRFAPSYLRDHTGLPAALRTQLHGSISWVMFVDYESANCGPYRELLFIPGSSQFSSGRFLTISRIYVSTEASVVNGRANWGIPKEQCDFRVDRSGGQESIELTRETCPIARLSFRAFGPRFPMILGLLPKRWLTLGQHLGSKEFIYAPEAKGTFRLARVRHAWSHSAAFPDFGAGRILGCFEVPRFQMTFPVSRIRDLPISDPPSSIRSND